MESPYVFQAAVTQVPADWANEVSTVVYKLLNAPTSVKDVLDALGLKSLSAQDASNVRISGGEIINASLGSAGKECILYAKSGIVLAKAENATDIVNLAALQGYITEKLPGLIQNGIPRLGSISSQNAEAVQIAGGTLDAITIGGGKGKTSIGTFSSLRCTGIPYIDSDVITLSYLQAGVIQRLDKLGSMSLQDSDNIDITGGAIDGCTIGGKSLVQLFASAGSVVAAPSKPIDIANKKYVDAVNASTLSRVKSMAYQESSAVSITGGTLNGVNIGEVIPFRGKFSSLVVESEAAYLDIVSSSMSASPVSGVRLCFGQDMKGLLQYSDTGGKELVSLSSVVPMRIGNTTHYAQLDTTSATLEGKVVLGATPSSMITIGSNTAKAGFKTTLNGRSWVESLTAKRGVFSEGFTQDIDNTFVNGASGTILLNVAASSVFPIRLTGNLMISLGNCNANQSGLFKITLFLIQTQGKSLVGYPANVVWASNLLADSMPPSYAGAQGGAFDIVELYTFDNGGTWYGKAGVEPPPAMLSIALGIKSTQEPMKISFVAVK